MRRRFLFAQYAAAASAAGITTEDLQSLQTESGENIEQE